jgi:glycine cleavage system H lipoate-binding protein
MVAALVLVTILVFGTIDFVGRRKERTPAASLAPVQATTQVLEGYFHPSHSWALVKESHSVIVGVDDLMARVMGKLDRIEIADKGAAVYRGEPLIALHSGSRSLCLGSLLSGVVEDINTSLSAHLSLVAASPFERGWIAEVAPGDLSAEVRDLLNGTAARQ